MTEYLVAPAHQITQHYGKASASPDGWHKSCCPAHKENRPSFSMRDPGIAGSCPPVVCHKGCSREQIYEALKRDGFLTEVEKRTSETETVYPYEDASEEIVCEKVKILKPDGKKTFFFQRQDETGAIVKNTNGITVPLFHLPQLLRAKEAGLPLLVVEGEKDVLNTERFTCGSAAVTTNPHGAGKDKWKHFYTTSYLKGFSLIYVIPDNDQVGKDHANQIAASINKENIGVHVVSLPGLPEKGDISDWIEAGHTLEEFASLLSDSKPWEPPQESFEPVADTFEVAPQPVITQEDESQEVIPRAWPTALSMESPALTGLAGQVVDLACENSEADRVGVLASLLTIFGVACGPNPHTLVGNKKHFARIYSILIGRSGRARKGTSFNPIETIFNKLKGPLEQESSSLFQTSYGPLSSGEGLVSAVRDPGTERDKEGNLIDKGADDKKLLVVEEEFAAVLRQFKKDGNSLSVMIRRLFDDGQAEPLTKNNKIKCTDAHVGIIGHITQADLSEYLNKVDMQNGTMNRMLFIAVRRGKLQPDPKPMPVEKVDKLALKLLELVRLARSRGFMARTEDFNCLWTYMYAELTKDYPGALGDVTSRAEAIVLRLSLIYALLDGQAVMNASHLRSALAFWDFAFRSAQYIFGEYEKNSPTEKILAALATGEKTQTEINKALDGKTSSEAIGELFAQLESLGRVTRRTEGGGVGKGRAKTIWSLSEGYSHTGNSGIAE